MEETDSDTDSYAGSAASITLIQESSEAKVAEQVERAFDSLPLDRAIVVESRHSGLINALSQDLARLKAEAQPYYESCAADLARWQSLLKKTEANVEWLKTRVAQLLAKEKALAPIEYTQAETEVLKKVD